jgi:hypothetical protein
MRMPLFQQANGESHALTHTTFHDDGRWDAMDERRIP